MTKILCVHGIGGHGKNDAWKDDWSRAIAEGYTKAGGNANDLDIQFTFLDELFLKHEITFWGTAEALFKLIGSAVTSPFRSAKGLGSSIRMTAGMVVQWVENEQLRAETRERVVQDITTFNPDVIIGHSLGSLVTYDTLLTNPSLIRNRIYVTCGSQIGNAFVVGNFAGGRLMPLAASKYWYHLYNEEDDAFTAEISLRQENFSQVVTYFDVQGFLDHDVVKYMNHNRTCETVWARVVNERLMPKLFRSVGSNRKGDTVQPKNESASTSWTRPSDKRALLIGINDYPSADMQLQGCVNDVFLVSSVLQERGFDPGDIRTVLDSRATAQGIRERIHWLLDDVQDGDVRILYYSGHGAQMNSYGLGDRFDRKNEALVPYDFDWTDDKAVTDDWFYERYSQLPYGVQFVAFFDCCHSAGLTRSAVGKVRGITPPDDIRHRSLRWDTSRGMWVERENASNDGRSVQNIRLGDNGPLLRESSSAHMRARQRALGHKGPYKPSLFYACKEQQYSYEYLHGSIHYGAFTFALCKTLREHWTRSEKGVSLQKSVASVRTLLKELGYEQSPTWVGNDVKF